MPSSRFECDIADDAEPTSGDPYKQGQNDSDSTMDESDQEPQHVQPTELNAKSKLPEGDEPASTPLGASPKSLQSMSEVVPIVKNHDILHGQMSSPSVRDSISNGMVRSSDDEANAQTGLDFPPKLQVNNTPAGELTVPRPKTKLGKIGGRSKAHKDDKSQQGGHRESSAPRSKSELSIRKCVEEDLQRNSPTNDSDRIEGARAKPEASPPRRESSQERANRKREQLKRELQDKSQASAKKKRRF